MFAQVNPDSSRIIGETIDQVGRPLSGVTVSFTHNPTGKIFITTSNTEGEFLVDFMPAGMYTASASLENYLATESDFELVLGQELPLTLILVEEGFVEEVSVRSSIPPIPSTTTDSVTHIPTDILASLPLNGRDFSDLVALAPQVVSDSEERIHIGGGRGIFTSYFLDGVDNNSSFFGEERGGTLPPFTLSQTAVAEFQISQVPFSVQYGGAAGGIVNAVTRSGSSTLMGDVFLYFKNDALVGKDAADREPEDFEQTQYGLTLGGPFSPTWFYFLSADIQDYSHPTFREWDDPTGALNNPDNIAYLSQFLNLDRETGTINQTNDEEAFLVRIDGQLSTEHSLSARIQRSNQEGMNLTDDFRTTGYSNNGIEKDDFWSFAFHLTSVLGQGTANEIVFQYADENRPREATVTGLPEVIIGSGYEATFGQKNYLPNSVEEKILEFRDNFTFFWKAHTFRLGARGVWSSFSDWFYRYQQGSYFYESWNDFFSGEPSQFTQSFSDVNGLVEFDSTYMALYAQDTYRWDRWTLTGGLRYERQTFSDPDLKNPLLPPANEAPSFSDFSPRISFAWDIQGDGTRVLRGGWGRFVSTTPALLVATPYLFNGVTVSRFNVGADDPAMPDFPNTLHDAGDLAEVTPDVYYFASDFEQPRVDRTVLEYEQALGRRWTVSIGGHYAAFDRLERKQDQNLTILGENQYDSRNRPNSDFKRMVAFVSDSWGRYSAITVQARYRSPDLFLHAHYTYSKSKDNDSNERSTSTRDLFPEDQYDLSSSWGNSSFDSPHRVVVYGSWSFHPRWALSGQAIAQSGFPYTALSHADSNGDGYYTDFATYDGVHYGRNTFRQPTYKTLDLRLSYTHPLGPGSLMIMLDAFNLFDWANWTTDQYVYTMKDAEGNVVLNPTFGDETLPGAPRQFQIGLRYSF